MAVKRISSDIDVVTAARQRIKNVFSNGAEEMRRLRKMVSDH